MSIASAFRAKMDVVLASADYTRDYLSADARRAHIQRDLDEAGYIIMEKEMVAALMEKASKL